MNYRISRKSRRINRGSRPISKLTSCVNESKWRRTVSENEFGETITNANVSDYTFKQNFLRRQENVISKFEREIPSSREYNCEIPRHKITTGITEDFSKNLLDDFEFKEDDFRNNELRARDFVKASNPSRHHSHRFIADTEVAFLDSLEKFNICRNCKQCIKTKKITIGASSVNTENQTEYDKFINYSEVVWQLCINNLFLGDVLFVKITNLLSQQRDSISYETNKIEVGYVETHHEVYWDCVSNSLKYRVVEAGYRFNSKCQCLMVETRRKKSAVAKMFF